MSFGKELAGLFRRDLTRLSQEIRAFPDDLTLWRVAPGVTNCAGNLVLHLEGNLREYFGRQLAGVPYQRDRSREFSASGVPQGELAARVEALLQTVPGWIESLPEGKWDAPYPEQVLDGIRSTRQFAISLHGHFNWHLGQIDYLRRVLTGAGALKLAGL
jgi:hypothetical protein